MDDTPSSNRVQHLAVEVGLAVVLCVFVVGWWAGWDSASHGSTLFVVFMHIGAAYQAAKLGWIFYWWRRLTR